MLAQTLPVPGVATGPCQPSSRSCAGRSRGCGQSRRAGAGYRDLCSHERVIWQDDKAVRLELLYQEASVRADVDFGGYRELDCAQKPDRDRGCPGCDHNHRDRCDADASIL